MNNTIAACRRGSMVLAVIGGLMSMPAGAVSLAPEISGQFKAGTGVDAHFLKVPSSWQQSSVLYDPVTDQLGQGVPISNFPGGTGLWGLADWTTAFTSPTDGMIEARWSGRVSKIAFGDRLLLGPLCRLMG